MHDHPDVWLHIDAAWAGVTFACPEYREHCRLPAINKFADSLCINLHKVGIMPLSVSSITAENATQWGLVNFDCSVFWVRDRKNLTEALDITPPFLRSTEGDAGS